MVYWKTLTIWLPDILVTDLNNGFIWILGPKYCGHEYWTTEPSKLYQNCSKRLLIWETSLRLLRERIENRPCIKLFLFSDPACNLLIKFFDWNVFWAFVFISKFLKKYKLNLILVVKNYSQKGTLKVSAEIKGVWWD